MTRQLGALLLCVAIAACGGGKKGQTTPAGGGGSGSDDQSMRDPGDPGGAGGTGGTGGTGGAGGTGGTGGPGDTAGGGTTPTDGPPIIPPNLDSDPAQVKSAVDGHLAAAKSSLSSNPPDADGALRAAREALKLDATNVDAGAYVAFAYYHKRLYDTAELVLDELLKRDKENGLDIVKKNANVNYVYGLIYDKKNQPERAFRAFQMAVELDGRHASALVNLGVHQLRNSQYSEAQRTFERLTKEFGRADAVTLTSLGSAYRGRSADYPQGASERDQFVRSAEAAYKRALQANSAYGPAYYNLGLLYLDTDPYPGVADTLLRLNTAKQYFDQYKNMPNFDVKLYESRTKDVDRAIKRAQKMQKQKQKTK